MSQPLTRITLMPEDPDAEGPRVSVTTWAEAEAALAEAPDDVSVEYKIHWKGDRDYPAGYGAAGRVYFRAGEERQTLAQTVRRHRAELVALGADAGYVAQRIMARCELEGGW